MNKKINKYVVEILAIAKANDVTFDVACNMFFTNVKAKFNKYPGADINWGDVAAELGDFTDKDESDMRNTFNIDYRNHISEINAYYREKKYDKIREVMENA